MLLVSFLKSAKLNLRKADEYKYLKQSNCYSIAGVDDAERFRVVTVCLPIAMMFCFAFSFQRTLCLHILKLLQEAMEVVHISKEDQENVFAMLAAVLWLGNISFTVIDNENHVEVVADEGTIFTC